MAVVNLPRELLDFYEGLEQLLQNLSDKVSLPRLEITDAIIKEHYSKGTPLFTLVPPKVEKELYKKAFTEVCGLLQEKRPQTKQQVQSLIDATGSDIAGLVQAFIEGDDKEIERMVKENQLSRITVDFILENTAKPVMKAYAKLVGTFTEDEDWQRNYCPVCGNKARYASISGEDNKRYLHCNLCGHQWLFKRLACPNCSNEDHKTLKTLLVDETPNFQIHVCEQCKTYLKVFDSRQGIGDNTGLKDAKTVFLDIIAQQQGYISNYFVT